MTATRVFTRGDYRIGVATNFGPRVVSLSWRDGAELFAQLEPSVTVEHPDRPYVLHGGHRLWVAPEVPAVTYAPDDAPCEVREDGETILIEANPDGAGIAKRIVIEHDEDRLRVEHRLTNAGETTVHAAPWAISQVPHGGEAILPLGQRSDPESFQADRRLILWPYTDLSDSRIEFGPNSVRIAATAGPRLKLGSGPLIARVDYVRGAQRLTKTFEVAAGEQTWADLGAVAQVFCGQDCAELETLGPVVALTPGESTTHVEYWTVQHV
ncbi:MAG: hypothetical protein IH940_00690 [Acidobacteria bacterium]|nr:hypothetical protein [Acidobacteriota bacterium]